MLYYRVASVDNLMYVKEDLIIPQVIGLATLSGNNNTYRESLGSVN